MPSSSVRIEEIDSDGDNFDVDNMDFDLPSAPAQPLLRPSGSGTAGQSSSSGGVRKPTGLSAQQQQQAMFNALGGASGAAGPSFFPSSSTSQMVQAPDPSIFKHYQAIYPIYIDAARAHKNGERRVNRSRAIRHPKAQEMAEVASRIPGIKSVFEPEKSHPRDWANPGRVRVLFKDKSGNLLNRSIPDKLTLLNTICELLQRRRTMDPPAKGITGRLPIYSPAISFGSLDEAVKGGGKMNEMMKAMMGGGGGAGAIAGNAEAEEEVKRKQEEKENAEKQRLAKMKALQKQGRRVVRR